MSGGASPRSKGSRFERAIVHAFQEAGLAAERVPLSGACGGSYLGDLTVPLLGRDLVVEAKIRATGFSQLYRWLEHRDALILRSDHHQPLAVVPMKLAIEIARAAELGRTNPNSEGSRKCQVMK